jgi:hypothetical protein
MEAITVYIEKIEILLIQVLNIFESLNDDNFESQLNSARDKMDTVKKIKTEIQGIYKKEEMIPFEEKLHFLAKQIEERFDNMIKEKNLERDRIGQEIEQLKNKKKLQNYRR